MYFSRQAKFPDRTATRAIPTSTSPPRSGSGGGSNHTGAIVGGAVGGGVGLILILGLLVCCCLRRRRPKEPKETPRQNSIHELPGQRYSIAEADTNPTKPSPGSVFTDPMYGAGASTGMPSISPTQSSQHQLLPPGEYSNHAPPTNQHPVFLAPLPEHQISPASPQFYQPQPQSSYSPQQQHHYSPASQHSPHTPNFVLPDPNLSHPYPQPGPQPYDPNQHLLHQQHFPPPQGSHTETLSTFPRSAWSQSTRTYGSTDPSSAHSPISPGGYSEPSYPPSQTQTPAQFYPQPRQVSAQEGEGGVRRLGSGASASSARWKGRLSPSGGKFIEGD